MSIPVTVKKTDGTIASTTTGAYASAYRPDVGDYLKLTSGVPSGWYTVRWVAFEVDAAGAPKVTIGAALPSDPSPPPPT